MKSILIIADSYGGPRVHANQDECVLLEKTYPEIIRQHFDGRYDVKYTALSYRRMTNIADIIRSQPQADIYIIQAGIVDAFPRPLSFRATMTKSFFYKLLRKIVRLNRAFFIRYFRSKPWTSLIEFQSALQQIQSAVNGKELIYLGIAPVNVFQNKQTPGANKNIALYNKTLSDYCATNTISFLDIEKEFAPHPSYEPFLHALDSHLTKDGNDLYARMIISEVSAMK